MYLGYEKKLWKKGYEYIAGLDEAGRGSWAGPVVAAAVILPRDFKIKNVKDSKQLKPKDREKLFALITKKSLAWGVGIISEKTIDEVGILEATKQAFLQAINKLETEPDFLTIDGVGFFKPNYEHEFIIKGDDKIISISAASIIAKVTRDALLNYYHQTYPEYSFDKHKGYGTPEHQTALENFGPSEIHRLTYKPIEDILLSSFEMDIK